MEVGGFAPPPHLTGFPEAKGSLDPEKTGFEKTSQYVGWAPDALLVQSRGSQGLEGDARKSQNEPTCTKLKIFQTTEPPDPFSAVFLVLGYTSRSSAALTELVDGSPGGCPGERREGTFCRIPKASP